MYKTCNKIMTMEHPYVHFGYGWTGVRIPLGLTKKIEICNVVDVLME